MKSPCVNCIHRGPVPGDAHSCCNHPKVQLEKTPESELLSILASVGRIGPNIDSKTAHTMGIKLNPYGVRNGWANWPCNFDPIWVEQCNISEEKKQ